MSARPNEPGVLLVVGDLVEDIVIWPQGPIAHGTDTDATVHRRRGGSAANVAEHAALLGVPTRFIGAVGNDLGGRSLVSDLTSSGVDVRVQHGSRTGTIVVLVDETGERTMLVDRGAALELRTIPDEWLVDADWVHIPAYSLATPELRSTIASVVSRMRAYGARVSADASSVAVLAELGVHEYIQWVREVEADVLFANADEAAVLAIDMYPFAHNPVVVVKQGPDPVVVFGGPAPLSFEVPVVENVRDTTGAGDAFAAGFLVAFRRGGTISESVAVATRTAQSVLHGPGAGSSPGVS